MQGSLVWLAYARIKGIGRARLRCLMESLPDPAAAWELGANDLSRLPGWDEVTADATIAARPEAAEVAAREWEAARRHQMRLLTLGGDGYPELLAQIPDPPPLLYAAGPAPLNRLAVSIVGSRKATPYGLSIAERWGRALAEAGVTVVSGMATGIDSAAHRGALAAGGNTVAVLGCGADVAYPREAAALHRTLLERGAVLSEHPPGTKPLQHHFPERNRIISGLSLGVLIVEAGDRSGTLITAGCALEQGRDVFAVPGPVTSLLSAGPHRLIRDGAVLVTSPEELLQELAHRWTHLNVPGAVGQAAPSLSESEALLWGWLGDEARGPEELALATSLKAGEIQAALTTLELKGLVRRLPGGLYIRISG